VSRGRKKGHDDVPLLATFQGKAIESETWWVNTRSGEGEIAKDDLNNNKRGTQNKNRRRRTLEKIRASIPLGSRMVEKGLLVRDRMGRTKKKKKNEKGKKFPTPSFAKGGGSRRQDRKRGEGGDNIIIAIILKKGKKPVEMNVHVQGRGSQQRPF